MHAARIELAPRRAAKSDLRTEIHGQYPAGRLSPVHATMTVVKGRLGPAHKERMAFARRNGDTPETPASQLVKVGHAGCSEPAMLCLLTNLFMN